MTDPVWERRRYAVTDHKEVRRSMVVTPFNNLEMEPNGDGPPGFFGLHASIEHEHGNIDVWLLCTKLHWAYYKGGSPEEDLAADVDKMTLESRRWEILDDFAAAVKKALARGVVLANDEIHIRLGADLRTPEYGPEWRRALRDD